MNTRVSSMNTRILAIVLLLAGTALSARADVTTWTSVSGAQVEARFVGMEHDQVVLQPEEGDEVVIRVNFLIPEDQIRARELHAAATPPTQDDTGEDDGRARLPALTSGPGQGHFAYYEHALFDAWVTRDGRLYIHPKEDGKRVGRRFYIQPQAVEHVHGNPSARVFAFPSHGTPAQQPQTVNYTARARRDEAEMTFEVEITFSQNRICVATEIIDPRRFDRDFRAWSRLYFGRVEDIPAQMPQAQRVALLERNLLRWRTVSGRSWREQNYYDTTSLRGQVDRAEIRGPWGGRTVLFDGENRRDGNRTTMWNYAGRPLNDGFSFIHQVNLGRRAGRICVTIE